MDISREFIEKRLRDARNGKLPVPENMDRATAALFWEKRHTSATEERGLTPIYNLSMRDHNGTLSMYQLYMQCSTEYEAALVLLGTLRHWSMLLECKWFLPHIEQWRKDMAARDEALGRGALIQAASGGNYAAGKALLNDAGKRGTKQMTEKGKGKDGANTRIPRVVSSTEEQLLARAQQLKENVGGGRTK